MAFDKHKMDLTTGNIPLQVLKFPMNVSTERIQEDLFPSRTGGVTMSICSSATFISSFAI